jgi:pyrophosphatase PpaX
MTDHGMTDQKPVRAVLFDFDGTLADTTPLILQSFQYTVNQYLGYTPTREDWMKEFGRPLAEQLGAVARSPEEAAAMLETYSAYQWDQHEALVKPFPGVMELIDELDRRGLRLAIVTSKYRKMTLRGLDVCGMMEHFDQIVTPEDVTHSKPHPESVTRALAALGVAPEEALMVGDSPHDIMSGRDAGTRTVGILWGGPFSRELLEAEGPDFLVEHPSEILKLL